MQDKLNTEAPLCPGFNQLMLDIAREVMPQGWDAIEGAPDTLADLKLYHAETGRIAVNVSSRFGLTVGEPEPYYAFRAWHDLLHVLHDEADRFTIPGERKVADLHRAELVRRLGDTGIAHFYADLIQVEVDAANNLYVETGAWPTNPREFALGWLLGKGWPPRVIAHFTGEPKCEVRRACLIDHAPPGAPVPSGDGITKVFN